MEEIEIPTEHLHEEINENAEENSKEKWALYVALSTAFMAVLAAIAGLLSGHHVNEAMIDQIKSSDQWAFYQAKDIRRHNYELFLDELSVFTVQKSDQADKIKDKYEKETERYRDQQKDIEAEAKKAEDEVKVEGRRADRYDLGEVLLEAALVICSITLLTRKKLYWGMGLVLAVIGIAIGASGFFVH